MNGRFDRALAEHFSFDEADLRANRALRMSDTQQRRMQQGAAATRSHLPKVLMVLVVGAVVVGVLIALQQGGDSKQLPLAIGASAVAVLVVATIAITSSRRTARRLEEGCAVEVVDGPVFVRTPKFKLDADFQHYSYREVGIGEVSFILDPEDADAFVENDHYRIYYGDLWGTGTLAILSVERFPVDPTSR